MDAIMDFVSNLNTLELCIVGAIIISLVIGLFKKTLWLCIVAVVLAGGLTFFQPEVIEPLKESVIEFFDNAIDPFKTEDKVHDVGDDAIGDIEK